MINDIDIICDRCGKTVHGILIEASAGIPKITGGFYDVADPSVWGEFALTLLEKSVCDECMWADPRFLERYPGNRKVPATLTPTKAEPLPEALADFIRDAGIAKRESKKMSLSPEKALREAKKLEKEIQKLEKERNSDKDPKPPKDK